MLLTLLISIDVSQVRTQGGMLKSILNSPGSLKVALV